MNTKLIEKTEKGAKIEVFVPFGKSMLESEDLIQEAVNEVGAMATEEVLKDFDTDGSPIEMGDVTFYSKTAKVNKKYETPYGPVTIGRYVYQSSKGGSTFCPLDQNARIITSSTPRFAKIVSHKYSAKGGREVCNDLEISNGRQIAKSFVQNISETVGSIALLKEESWHYKTPKLDKKVTSISIGLDATCMYVVENGYREAMVGTISLYDSQCERLHTTYIAERPEYGKGTFLSRFEREIKNVQKVYPNATDVGLADGAKDNWAFLQAHTSIQTIDFYHVTGYIGKAASVMFKDDKQKEEWISTSCHNLKHKQGAAKKILAEIIDFPQGNLSKENKEKINSTITYFSNNILKMRYSKNVKNKLPIGSGVTEAACKVIVKQRLCCSGMKWKDRGAGIVLSLRCMERTEGRWDQFWNKIDQYGVPSFRKVS